MEEPTLGRRELLKAAALSATVVGTAGLANATTAKKKRRAKEIPLHTLGKTGLKVPILQLGTSQRLDPTYDKIMHRCVQEGVTWFDTALSYGWGASHRAIANFLEQTEDRKKMWITSKSGSGSPGGLAEDLDQALSELETDYLDLYLMHGIRRTSMLDRDYLKMGERLKKTGKTRLFGFSCHDGTVVELMNKAAKVGGVDVILFRYNFRRYGDRDLNLAIDACHKAGIGLMAMKTMGSVPKDQENVQAFRSENFTLGQAKLKSVWADERIDTVLSEMDSVRLVRENVAAARSEKALSANELHQLNQLAALTAPYSCQGCGNICESVVGGDVAIADPLRYLMYHECHGKTESARSMYRALPDALREFEKVDLSLASSVCPQGIDIQKRLNEAKWALA